MRIVHLSDLHFGTEEDSLTILLKKKLDTLHPDLVIVSGDFTQTGSRAEFVKARIFMDRFTCPVLSVPGNHDVPRYNLLERFGAPFGKYKTYISRELHPVFETDEIITVGLNSARRALPHWNWANGAISARQREDLKTLIKPDDPRWTICALHHPVHKVEDMPLDVTVFGRKRTMAAFREAKLDLVLTGHVHHASITTIGDETHQSVYLSASTALSSRTRKQENGFNVIDLTKTRMAISCYRLKDGSFEIAQEHIHKK